MADYDLAIIGGGIHGCGVARDAAGRGLSVLLVEQRDLGSGTSSASTKLIHGGLRYLEHLEFRLVRESLHERELLLRLAPHLASPLRIVLPVTSKTRRGWQLRLGLKLYDLLAGSSQLPRSRELDLADDPAGVALKPGFRQAFEFSDCTVDDARLVVANAIAARERGATIRTRTRCVAARREDGVWKLVLQSPGKRESVSAHALVNAAGPWAGQFAENVVRVPPRTKLKLVKGSHIVLPRLQAHDRAYLLQHDDGRVVFAIPFAESFTLVGTTDIAVSDDPAQATASSDEILYLCKIVGAYFRANAEPARIVWTFAGVRPLIDDGSKRPSDTTRDYRLEVDARRGEAPLVSILGGKLTTYRSVAASVMDRLGRWIVTGPAWTDQIPLPGGDLGAGGVEGTITELQRSYPFLTGPHARRMARAYGTRAGKILGNAQRIEDLGPRIVADLHAVELDYLRREEWAASAEDVLWRRTKLGLVASAAEVAALKAIFGAADTEEVVAR